MEQTSGSRSLRVRAHGLRPGEPGLVRALLTLMASDRREECAWVYSESDWDAEVAEADQNRVAVRARHGRTELIARPISAPLLEDALARIADDAERAASIAAAPSYRLVGWPPAELLRGDRVRLRIATALSRQALGRAELERLTGLPAEQFDVFLRSLQSFGVLQVCAPAAMAPVRPAAEAPMPVSTHASGWSLVRAIRRKLGLGGQP